MESQRLLMLCRSLFPQGEDESEMSYFARIRDTLTQDESELVAAELSFEQDQRIYR